MVKLEAKLRKIHRGMRKGTHTIQNWWAALKVTGAREVARKIVDAEMAAEKRLNEYKNSFRFITKIRPYVSEYLYTDVRAYEVVRVISDKCVEIRELHTELKRAPKEFYPGGFSGHYADNHAQEWVYTSDTENPVSRIRLGKKGWGRGRFRMHNEPYKFHDYNF